MSIATVRAGLVTRAKTITGLDALGEVPDVLPKLPVIVFEIAGVDYEQPGTFQVLSWKGWLLVADRDAGHASTSLDAYLDRVHTSSIKTALETWTASDWCVVKRAANVGPIAVPWAEQTFFGAEFDIDVGDTDT